MHAVSLSVHWEVVVGCLLQARSLRPMINEIEGHRSNKQRDRKMDEDDVLRVFCEQHGLRFKRIQPKLQERQHHVDNLNGIEPLLPGNIPLV